MIVIGIDPGKGGGRSIINNQIIKEIYKCPNTIKEMAEILRPYKLTWDFKAPIVAYIEQVHAFPTDGRSSAFKFGVNYGVWQGLLGANKIETRFIAPQMWMKSLELPKSKVERKKEIKRVAQGVIDSQGTLKKKVTLHTSDAVLIGMYGVITTAVSKLNLKEKIEFINKYKGKNKC